MWFLRLSILTFQSHAGSIEAYFEDEHYLTVWMFQSHAGSIEARTRRHKRPGSRRVSIPRWFD